MKVLNIFLSCIFFVHFFSTAQAKYSGVNSNKMVELKTDGEINICHIKANERPQANGEMKFAVITIDEDFLESSDSSIKKSVTLICKDKNGNLADMKFDDRIIIEANGYDLQIVAENIDFGQYTTIKGLNKADYNPNLPAPEPVNLGPHKKAQPSWDPYTTREGDLAGVNEEGRNGGPGPDGRQRGRQGDDGKHAPAIEIKATGEVLGRLYITNDGQNGYPGGIGDGSGSGGNGERGANPDANVLDCGRGAARGGDTGPSGHPSSGGDGGDGGNGGSIVFDVASVSPSFFGQFTVAYGQGGPEGPLGPFGAPAIPGKGGIGKGICASGAEGSVVSNPVVQNIARRGSIGDPGSFEIQIAGKDVDPGEGVRFTLKPQKQVELPLE